MSKNNDSLFVTTKICL